ncbi:hypothetical protein ACU686_38485 [Yinghuangia aomiensis]
MARHSSAICQRRLFSRTRSCRVSVLVWYSMRAAAHGGDAARDRAEEQQRQQDGCR